MNEDFRDKLRTKLKEQDGRCAWSKVQLRFPAEDGWAKQKTKDSEAKSCHPLYATVDHSEPNSLKHGFEIVCYHLNDIKGQLPHDCFVELKKSPSWGERMTKWKEYAERYPDDEGALRSVLKSNLQ